MTPKRYANGIPVRPQMSGLELNRRVAEFCNGREHVSVKELWKALGISSTTAGRVLLKVGYVREGKEDVWARVWPPEQKFRQAPRKVLAVTPAEQITPISQELVPCNLQARPRVRA